MLESMPMDQTSGDIVRIVSNRESKRSSRSYHQRPQKPPGEMENSLYPGEASEAQDADKQIVRDLSDYAVHGNLAAIALHGNHLAQDSS